FRPDQERRPLGNLRQLVEPEVPVVKSGAVEESPARVADPSQGFRTKSALVEILIGSSVRPRVAWILEHQPADEIGLVNARCSRERAVATLRDGDRESRGESGDAVHAPPLRQPPRRAAKHLAERNLVVVAEYEIVGDVE